MVTIHELERRRSALQDRADEISEHISSCSKSAGQNSCGILISERNSIMIEMSEINTVIRAEMKKSRM